MLRRLGYILLAIVLIGFSIWGFQAGFSRLSEVRQLDRLPITPITALTEGDYALEGDITQANNAIITPYSKEAVVYYRYQLQETYTDSDGEQQTRVLDRGESATSFNLLDSTGQVIVQPGASIAKININAPETYRRQIGKLTYTEYTLSAGNHLQLTGHYSASVGQVQLAELSPVIPKIITTQTLAHEGGQSLFWLGLVISASVGSLAIGVALLLSGLAVHRFWVFVVVMTISIVGALTSIGIKFIQEDWQQVANLYSERAQAALNAPLNLAAQEDLYRYYLLLQKSATGWPDSALFKSFAQENLKIPILPDLSRERINDQLQTHALSKFETAWLTYLLSLVGVILCVSLVWVALLAIRFKRLVEFIPTSKSTGLAYGLAELSGTVQLDSAMPKMLSRLNQEACVAYRYSVEERQGTGKNKRWVEIESEQSSVNFLLEDNLGQVPVNPTQANIRYPNKTVNRKHSRRYTEYWLPPLTQIYCLGFAGLSEQDASTLVMQNSDDMAMLISTEDEQKVISSQGSKGFLLTGVALAFGLMAGTVWLSGSNSFTPLDLLTVSLIVPVILLIITLAMHYNSLVFLRQRVNKTAADIDTLLQKRHDLWPRLLETVKGYLEHESRLLSEIASVRNTAMSVQDATENTAQQLASEEKIVNRLIALSEQHPELKANKVVTQFIDQMQRTEDELALVRQGYNDSVSLYNTQIEKLPDVVLAKIFSFKAASFFHKLKAA